MATFSAYLANALLAEVLTGVGYTSPTHCYLALYTTNPTSADSGTEVTGGSYVRPIVTFTAPSGLSSSNSATVNISNMPATTVYYIGLRDALTAGNLLFFGPLAVPRTTASGDTFTVLAGDLEIALV